MLLRQRARLGRFDRKLYFGCFGVVIHCFSTWLRYVSLELIWERTRAKWHVKWLCSFDCLIIIALLLVGPVSEVYHQGSWPPSSRSTQWPPQSIKKRKSFPGLFWTRPLPWFDIILAIPDPDWDDFQKNIICCFQPLFDCFWSKFSCLSLQRVYLHRTEQFGAWRAPTACATWRFCHISNFVALNNLLIVCCQNFVVYPFMGYTSAGLSSLVLGGHLLHDLRTRSRKPNWEKA